MFRTVGERTSVKSTRRSSQSSAKRRETPFESMASDLVDSLSEGFRSDRSTFDREPAASRTRSNQLRIDVPLLLTLITLLVFGLIIVYSASYNHSISIYGNPNTIFFRQVAWLIIGVFVATILVFLNYHYWRLLAVPLLGLTLVALTGVLFFNIVLNGAVRTLWGASVQPSELAKLVIIIYLSVWLTAKQDHLTNISFGLIPLATLLGVVGGLILLQPDFSAVVTLLALGGLLFFLAGGDLRQIVMLLVIALVVGLAIVYFSSTGSQRIQDWMIGLKDPTEASYHVRRAFEAFVNGGWFGSGLGRGGTKVTGLPVPPTDSIFAVVGEEVGVVGAVGLVMLYVIFFWRGMSIARRAPDQLGALLAAGVSLWIALEAFINMAVIVNLVPFAGNALPFISAGGSNLVMSLAAAGILLNVSRLAERRREENGQFFSGSFYRNAVINLRWRDRRRRVSRAERSASAEHQPKP
jgi:cell division protein FtsW